MASVAAFQVATINVKGMHNRRGHHHFRHLSKKIDVSVAAIQETKLSSDEETAAAFEPFLPEYNVILSHARGLSGRRMLFLANKLGMTAMPYCTGDERRLICWELTGSSIQWRIICVNAPVKQQDRRIFFLSLGDHL